MFYKTTTSGDAMTASLGNIDGGERAVSTGEEDSFELPFYLTGNDFQPSHFKDSALSQRHQGDLCRSLITPVCLFSVFPLRATPGLQESLASPYPLSPFSLESHYFLSTFRNLYFLSYRSSRTLFLP